MKIKVKDLRYLCNRLLDHAEHQLTDEIDLDYSMFWVIPFDKGQKSEVPDLFVGDLRDDIKYLLELLDKDYGSSDLDFERLGNIIKAIGYTIYKK